MGNKRLYEKMHSKVLMVKNLSGWKGAVHNRHLLVNYNFGPTLFMAPIFIKVYFLKVFGKKVWLQKITLHFIF